MGLFSRWLCDRADEHSLFRISQPRGEYILENEPKIYFFAGGIGIIPAISMMRTLATRKDDRPFYLDWSAPQTEDFVFATELNFLQKKFPNFQVRFNPTRAQGRLTLEQVKSSYSYSEGAVAFLCGPLAYMDAVRSHLLNAGWSTDNIRQELFSSRLDEDGNAEAPIKRAPVEVADGTILGDTSNVELTQQAIKLGWQPPATPTAFDYLPLIIQLPGKKPKWFNIPPEIILDVEIVHPLHQWFKELGLKWYALPAVCNMSLDLEGVEYSCTPFNGFYMGTEIGGRNFSDTYRYNMLPTIAERLELDCSSNDTLWKDQALIELNIAVLHSFKAQGVRLIDHHSMTEYFMEFMAEEEKCQRPVHADWGWIVPPISGSLTPVYPLELENRILKPNYFYMSDPWQSGESHGVCPFGHFQYI